MGFCAEYSINGKQKEGQDEQVKAVLSEYFDNIDVDEDGVFASGSWNRAYPEVERGLFEKLIPLMQSFRVEAQGQDHSMWGYEYKDGELYTFEFELVEIKRRSTTLDILWSSK